MKAARRIVGLVRVSGLGIHHLSRPQDALVDEDVPAGGNPRGYPAMDVGGQQVLGFLPAAFGLELARAEDQGDVLLRPFLGVPAWGWRCTSSRRLSWPVRRW